MDIKDLMSRDVVTIGCNDTLLMVDDLMVERHLRHLPVVEDHDVVGVVSQRDLFKARISSTMRYGQAGHRAFLHTVWVKEIMISPVITVSPETAIGETVDLMLSKGIGCLPVIEEGALVGIVTRTDLLRHLRHDPE
jgi:CBS-domain-containing membrane protein